MPYYPDLQDAGVPQPSGDGPFAVFDEHLSELGPRHPNRYMAHNGEINTLRGNMNWMFARQGMMKSPLYGADLQKLFPIMEPQCSDSGNFDNALELLLHAGRSLPEAVMMMIPEAWQATSDDARGQAGVLRISLGPAGAVGRPGVYLLHRRALHRRRSRPQRPATQPLLHHQRRQGRDGQRSRRSGDRSGQTCKIKGRLQPGRMFLVDFEKGRIIDDGELKHEVANRRPYRDWLRRQRHPAQ